MNVQIFSGCIPVASKVYDGPSENQPILVPAADEATMTLNYPFPESLVLKLTKESGYTKNELFDLIRDGFDVMYNGSVSTPIPGLINQNVKGEFGQSFHAIEDLVIEGIEYDDDAKEVYVAIGS